MVDPRPTNHPAPMPEADAATGPLFAQEEFARRRARLLASLDDAAVVLTAAHTTPRNDDVDYEFRQDSTFWYFT